jgi:hypothetical protein
VCHSSSQQWPALTDSITQAARTTGLHCPAAPVCVPAARSPSDSARQRCRRRRLTARQVPGLKAACLLPKCCCCCCCCRAGRPVVLLPARAVCIASQHLAARGGWAKGALGSLLMPNSVSGGVKAQRPRPIRVRWRSLYESAMGPTRSALGVPEALRSHRSLIYARC